MDLVRGKCLKVIKPKFCVAFLSITMRLFHILGQFKPVAEIIQNDLTVRQKEKLVEHIRASVRDLEVADAALLLPLLMGSLSIQEAVLSSVVTFVGKELGLQVVD